MDVSAARLLCVVVPCFDEEQAIGHTYAELKRVLATLRDYRHLLYFVDDGSRDGTLHELNELARNDRSVRVLSLSRNFGHQAAITAGLDHVDRRADAVLVMDADLENPPSLIPRLLAELERGHDIAMGVRAGARSVGRFKRVASRAFYWLFNRLSDVPIEPGAPEFFVLSRRAREALARMPEQRRFLRGMVAWLGFPRAHVAYHSPARVSGRSKYTLGRMLRFASDAIYAFSFAPVRLVLWLALALGLAAVTLFVGSVLALPWVGSLGPLLAIAALLCGLGGLQLFATGLLGGYVARSFEASRGRPLYLLKQGLEEHEREGQAQVHAISQRASRHS